MKDICSNPEMFEYYNERAPEYEAFYWGDFPSKIPNPGIYENDTIAIQKLLPGYISGRCIDIACGTGFWLPFYADGCTSITLIDQSESVLAECSRKIDSLKIGSITEVIQDKIYSHTYKRHHYDSALMGFIISHFTDVEMDDFFPVLKSLLATLGRFVIIDSLWNKEVENVRRQKSGLITRQLFDGREFKIYKRYFDKNDLHALAAKFHVNLEIIYWGSVFFMAAGRFDID